LEPPNATVFGLSAEIHDLEAPPKPGDANDAYAPALAGAVQQPFADIDATMGQTRVATHQASAGEQTPWHATNPSTPPFSFVLAPDPAQAQALSANLPSGAGPLDGLDPQAAYWAAIWRNTIVDYQNFLGAFSAKASPEQIARVQALLALLQQPNPICAAQAPAAPEPLIAGPACPEGFLADDGACAPSGLYLPCPPETLPIFLRGHLVCRIVHACPPELHPFWGEHTWRCGRPPSCRPGERDCPTPKPTPKPTPTPTPTPTCPPDRRCPTPTPTPTPTPLPTLTPIFQVKPACVPGVNCPPAPSTPPLLRRPHPYYPYAPTRPGWYRDHPGYQGNPGYRRDFYWRQSPYAHPYGAMGYRRWSE
jgi:hypothetical protein